MEVIIENYHIFASFLIMIISLGAVILSDNLVKKLIGLSLFQTAIVLFYVSFSYVEGADIPIIRFDADGKPLKAFDYQNMLASGEILYNNPLPHVLMLTAIVVGLAVLALGLSLIIKIKQEYDSIEESEVISKNSEL